MGKWTLMYYASGAGGLSPQLQNNIDDLMEIGSGDGVNIVCQYTARGSRTSSDRFRILQGGKDNNITIDRVIPGTPESLFDFIKWAVQNFPAERYGIILCGHGSGWEPEGFIKNKFLETDSVVFLEKEHIADPINGRRWPVLFQSTAKTLIDEYKKGRGVLTNDFSGHSLDSVELTTVFEEVKDILGQPMDFIGFDSCLMGCVEIGSALSGVAKYLVASEQVEPSSGWPQGRIASAFRKSPKIPTKDVLRLVPQFYIDSYSYKVPNGLTLSVVDLQLIGTIETEFSKLVMIMKNNYDNARRSFNSVLADALPFDADLWDICCFFEVYRSVTLDIPGMREAIAQVELSVRSSIVSFAHRGDSVASATGLSMYIPDFKGISPYYQNTSFGKESNWLDIMTRMRPPK